ncbi:copper resistance protein CopC, partial [Mycolicibacterium litorale]|uniref:copper resistance CopC family protein n=1 Tax=Mycolicibacterium litorale TaxID=758802 RepID=UPI0039A3569E
MRSVMPRCAAALLAVAFAVLSLAGAGTASAHASVIATDPADNASLSEAPSRVSATFNEPMQSAFAAMTVVGPDGNLWSTGAPQVQDAVVAVQLRPLGPTGTYTVNYRATSADGHVVTGSWAFELTVATAALACAAASSAAAARSPFGATR